MNIKKSFVIAGILILVLALASVVSAFGMMGRFGKRTASTVPAATAMDAYHDEMLKIMEQGTYADLAAFRQKIGFNIMPYVTDDATFTEAQEHHKIMAEWHKKAGIPLGVGMHGRGGGCPMMQAVN